jgi:hypothetical protein
MRAGAVPLPLPFAALDAGAALHASRRTPRINCIGEATKIED